MGIQNVLIYFLIIPPIQKHDNPEKKNTQTKKQTKILIKKAAHEKTFVFLPACCVFWNDVFNILPCKAPEYLETLHKITVICWLVKSEIVL